MGTDHGGVWQPSMYPSDSTLKTSMSYAGRTIRRGALALDVKNGIASLSPVLSASSAVLTPKLAQKMNVLRGLDISFYIAHHTGGHLGNYGENDGNGNDGKTAPRAPTIDQVLAWSSSFYPNLAAIKERALVIAGSNGYGGITKGLSANWSSPSTKSGAIQVLSAEKSSLVLFNKIFTPMEDPTKKRPPIVDRVLEDYKRLRSSNRRLSAADRQRLDDHIDRLDELQRKLNVQGSCSSVKVPSDSSIDAEKVANYGHNPDAQGQFWQRHNDVIAAAFSCDTCRIATMHVADIFAPFAGNYHQDVAHQANQSDGVKQAIIAAAHQRMFERVFLDLVAKLDAIADVQGTVLDNTLVQWTQESGCNTHDPIELPVVTAGGARGAIAAGQYCDFRDLTRKAHQSSNASPVTSNPGLVYNQWLGTVLQAMGLERAEYEKGQYGGYGPVQLSTASYYPGHDKYGPAELNVMGEMLPFVKG
jgi:hypothetical protein